MPAQDEEEQPEPDAEQRTLCAVAVAQNPGGLTGAFLRAGSKKPQVVAPPWRALPGLGAASALIDRHSERSPGSCRRLCATATAPSGSLRAAGEKDVAGPPRP
jgi:hypothetical protein